LPLLLRLEIDTFCDKTMKDTLEQFSQLKRKLTHQRETLTKRLAAIDAVLGDHQQQTGTGVRRGGDAVPELTKATKTARESTGKLTLAQAVLDAFGLDGGEKGHGKTIAELLPLVQATAGKTHKVTRPTVGLACFKLKNKGQIKAVGRGVYSLA
jgi:hypothetical protein